MGPLTETIAGKEVQLPELNTYDKHKLRQEYRKSEKAKLLAKLDVLQASREERDAAISAFDDGPPQEWVNYVNELDGLYTILRMSLEKGYRAKGGGPDPAAQAQQTLEGLDWPEGKLWEVAMKLADLKPKQAATPTQDMRTYGDGGDDAPNPQPGPVYGGSDPAAPTAAPTKTEAA